jgi:hypothetical protein
VGNAWTRIHKDANIRAMNVCLDRETFDVVAASLLARNGVSGLLLVSRQTAIVNCHIRRIKSDV